ncbi:MAG: hypothetical protein M1308_07765 [Actinobacteria bacterium]|nr:hypothetical protein [Actinomycetota bacterium]
MTKKKSDNQKKKVWLIVQMDVDPEYEDEYNKWYDTEHIPMFLKVPGVIGAKRAKLLDPYTGPKYITIYEYADDEVAKSKEYAAVLETPWAKKMMGKLKNWSLDFLKEMPGYWEYQYDLEK